MEQPLKYKHLGNPPWQDSGGQYASKWGFPRYRPKANDFRPLFDTSKKGIQSSQGKGWQAQDPKHRHPGLIKFMAKFRQKIATPYFA